MIKKYTENLQKFLGQRKPDTLIILGSGLGKLTDKLHNTQTISYQQLDFPQSTVSGHAGELVVGRLGQHEVVCMRGRFHLYEGHRPQVIKDVICAFAQIGIKNLIVTNAAGSLHADMPAGSVMMITDHINFSGQNPLIGPNDEQYGPRFVDMSDAYHLPYRQKVSALAQKYKIKLFQGVYLMVSGPNFETAAEIKAFQRLGADSVGMSTVPEVLAANYAGMKVLGFSVITNLGTGIQDKPQSHHETLEQAEQAADNLAVLVEKYLSED